MPTQKLPRPHVFTPPDLTLITHDDLGRQVKKPLLGRYGVHFWGRPSFRPDGLPADTRGLTCVIYTHPALYESQEPRHFYCSGKAYLHTPDVFSEPFGVALATVRAVTDLIEKHQPINAADIGVRMERYLDDVYEHFDFFNFELRHTQPLERALGKLFEAIQKCQASK